MLHRLLALAISLLFASMPIGSSSAAAPTKAEVTAQVKAAIAFYKSAGHDKALAEFNNKDGQFAKGEDYVDVHDLKGVCVAHPVTAGIVGMNRIDQTDPTGKLVYKELTEAAKTKPSGWIDYQRKNPTDGKIEHKTAYWEVYDGLIFKAGTYDAN